MCGGLEDGLELVISEIKIKEASLDGACNDLFEGLKAMEEFASDFTNEVDIKDFIEHGLMSCQQYNDAVLLLMRAMAKLRALQSHNENHPKKPKLKLNKAELEAA
jgi:hypothetical protein